MSTGQGTSASGGTRLGPGSSGERFFAPLGRAANGRLVFTSPVEGLSLLAAPDLDGLAGARFGPHLSWVGFETGILTVAYRQGALFPPRSQKVQPAALFPPVDEITLNASIPWEIEFHGAVSRLAALLCRLQLRSLDLLGGASQVTLVLPRPAGAAYLYLAGGACGVAIRRPTGVGVGLVAQDGISNLVLDRQWFRSLGRDSRLESPDFNPASPRYELSLTGEASQMTIE